MFSNLTAIPPPKLELKMYRNKRSSEHSATMEELKDINTPHVEHSSLFFFLVSLLRLQY